LHVFVPAVHVAQGVRLLAHNVPVTHSDSPLFHVAGNVPRLSVTYSVVGIPLGVHVTQMTPPPPPQVHGVELPTSNMVRDISSSA
jgi:hypothetical protein